MKQKIDHIFQQSIRLKEKARRLFTQRIQKVVVETIQRLEIGGRIYLIGNGGSAADAIHWAGELMGRFTLDRPGIPAMALCTDPAVITALANDYDFSHVFARQLETLAGDDDIVFALSTSGNSHNIVAALKSVSRMGCLKVGFTGENGGAVGNLVDILFDVPSSNTARVQEVHGLLGHIICELIEERLFGDRNTEAQPQRQRRN